MRKMLEESEKRTIATINKQMKAIKLKCFEVLSEKIQMESKYSNWQQKLAKKLKILETNQE